LRPFLCTLFLALFCSVGCAGFLSEKSPDYTVVTTVEPVWVDKGFTPEERRKIHAAIEAWNEALNGYERFEVQSDLYDSKDSAEVVRVHQIISNFIGGVVINAIKVGAPEEVLVDPYQMGVLGWFEETSNDIYLVQDRLYWRDFRTVVMHELGHELGAGHIHVAGALMYPTVERQGDCVDGVTAMLVASAHWRAGWDWKRMHTCPLADPLR
jgi:hypothetical protein